MIISQFPIAKKYALAYLNKYQNDLLSEDMIAFNEVYLFFNQHHNFTQLLNIMNTDKKIMNKLFEKICHHFFLPESAKLLMELLVKHRRLNYLNDVIQDICCLYKIRKNIEMVSISSADELSAETVKELETFFERESQKKVETILSVDKALIAGVRLQSNFLLWDYSVAARLRELRQKLIY
ncbi:ATP synthase F1 subunit delta [Candidatus Dependentiae bacterium]|nr:ATP synthase F1 subunit delta [Candidatus Dependentiae bacterium]